MTIKVKHISHKINYANPTRLKTKLKNPWRFYVYMWLRSKDSIIGKAGMPYYVGKGQGNRAYRKGCPIDKSNIVIVQCDMIEDAAFELEIKLIAQYGRKDLGTGILINLTDGGDGTSGVKISEETRKLKSRNMSGEGNHNFGKKNSVASNEKNRISNTGEGNGMFGRKHSTESNEKNRISNTGKKRSPEAIEKGRLSHIGLKSSDATKKKQSDSQKGKIHPIVNCPHCEFEGGGNKMISHHFDKCKYHPDRIDDLLISTKLRYDIVKNSKYKSILKKIDYILNKSIQKCQILSISDSHQMT
jgi:hypothetical protein